MDIFFKVKTKRVKFIFSIISAISYLIGYSIIMESGNFSVYFISYIHIKQTWVNIQFGNIMRPFILLSLSLFSPLSGPMEIRFGPRLSLLASAIVIEITLILFYIQRNLWIFYILNLFLGLGCGLSANITIKNSCFYYQKKKGFISACIMSLGALIGSSFTILGEKLINPGREKVEKDSFYSESISNRSKYFFLFGIIVLPISTALSLFFFYNYDPSFEFIEEEKIEKKIDEIKGPLLENNNKEESEDKNENKEIDRINVSNSFMKPSPKKNIKIALKSWRFWRITIISGVTPFGIYFIFATYRAYASLLKVDGDILGTLAGAMNIISSICNPIWAIFADKYGFQKIMKILSIFIIILPAYFIFFMENKLFYVIGLYLSCIFRGGIFSCINPHIMHIYGLRYYLTLGGFLRLFNQLANFVIAMLSIVISLKRDEYEELLMPYRIINIIGVIIGIIGLILAFYETDEKFKFGDEEEGNTSIKEKKKKGKKNKKISKEEKIKENEENNKEEIEVNNYIDKNDNKEKEDNIIEDKNEIKKEEENKRKEDNIEEDKNEIKKEEEYNNEKEEEKKEENNDKEEEKKEEEKVEKGKKEENNEKNEDNDIQTEKEND